MKVDILFSIMAVQEAVFFAPIAQRLKEEEGLIVAFLTFHEGADDILDKQGIPRFSLHKMRRSMDGGKANYPGIVTIEKSLHIDVSALLVHERLTANSGERALHQKVREYCSIIDGILRENNIGCVVQELGGFIAPQLLYYLSRHHDVNHIFIEPAMFSKRVVFTLNNLYADIPDYNQGGVDAALNAEVSALVRRYMERKTVVIPKKDRHFFQDMGFKRLFSLDNFKRLSRKLYHKYVSGRREEYDAIMNYALYHFKKLYQRKILSRCYSDPVKGERYIYFPFHVPMDVQLTVRCPEFLDQESLVDRMTEALPPDHMLYIKEHPAAIGGHSPARIRGLLKGKRVRLLHPGNNSFDIIRNSSCVVTINSKVGFEAIMQGRPIVVLGKTFYRGKGVTIDLEDMAELAGAIKMAMKMDTDELKRTHLLNRAFDWSFPGELYDNSPENIDNFYNSLRGYLHDCRVAKRSVDDAVNQPL